VVFFGQLALGLAGFERFLMTGNLHLPVPLMILSGPIFRGSIGFMPILFLCTLLVSGPAWCSQLCYFGVLDNLAADRKADLKPLRNKFRIKHIFLPAVIVITILLRFLGINRQVTTLLAAGFGVVGLGIIGLISRRRGKMVHCILWCPIGTLVNYMKGINPFRMYIDESCTDCLACTRFCQYDALNITDISKRKPGPTCTYCGDCLVSCKTGSIRYKFFGMSHASARNAWIVGTVSLHAIFLALGRI
jgi:polyferredoxin